MGHPYDFIKFEAQGVLAAAQAIKDFSRRHEGVAMTFAQWVGLEDAFCRAATLALREQGELHQIYGPPPSTPDAVKGHLIDGEFQSDKYPSTPRGKVPLSCKDPTAQDLLWTYAQRRRAVDAQFADDLETALKTAGYVPPAGSGA